MKYNKNVFATKAGKFTKTTGSAIHRLFLYKDQFEVKFQPIVIATLVKLRSSFYHVPIEQSNR